MSSFALKLLFTLTGCLALAACGGGTGAGPSPTVVTGTVAPPDPEPTNFNTAEYRRNYGLGQMNAIAAYDAGATGSGVTVAVIDTGIDIDHPQIEDNIHPSSTNIVTGRQSDLNDIDGHGTAVAGVIAAIRDPFNSQLESQGQNTHGVAFEAQVMALNTAVIGSCEEGEGECKFSDRDIAQALDYARERGVKIVNISLGGDSFNHIALVDAYKRAVGAGMVIVLAAGNKEEGDSDAHIAQPENSAAVAWADWANGQIIVAGAVDRSSTIADFSHRAGQVAKDVFLVAGGVSIPTLGADGGYFFYWGTSFAAPHISGAAALLMSAFPNLTGKQVADLLIDTATDLGAVGADVIYGRGLVNIEAAFAPQGATAIAVQGNDGATMLTDVNSSVLLGGTAFGDFSSFTAALGDSMMLDGLNRSYRVDLGQQVFNARQTIPLAGILDSGNGGRQSHLQLGAATRIKFSWREDWRFQEVDKHYFSHRYQARNRYHNLRMKLGLTLDKTRQMTFAQGLSLKETLEDYDQDAFLSIGKEDITTLMGRADSQSAVYREALSPRTSFAVAVGHGAREWQDYRLRADSYIALARLDHAFSPAVRMGLDLGVMNEQGSILGSLSDGAISLGDGATTTFLKARADWSPADGFMLFARASYGQSRVSAADRSLVHDVGTLSSASFSLGVTGRSLFQRGDRLSFAISQPLRVMTGAAHIAHVAARDYRTDTLSFVDRQVSLAPDGREIDFELAYQIADIWGARVDLNLLHQINPSHNAQSPDNSGLLIRLGTVF